MCVELARLLGFLLCRCCICGRLLLGIPKGFQELPDAGRCCRIAAQQVAGAAFDAQPSFLNSHLGAGELAVFTDHPVRPNLVAVLFGNSVVLSELIDFLDKPIGHGLGLGFLIGF